MPHALQALAHAKEQEEAAQQQQAAGGKKNPIAVTAGLMEPGMNAMNMPARKGLPGLQAGGAGGRRPWRLLHALQSSAVHS